MITEQNIDGEWHGFAEFIGIEDQTWTPRKIKDLLKSIIECELLQHVDSGFLISFLDVNKAANLSNNRHSGFMKNLIPASQTKSGLKKILDYAYSDDKVIDPPNLSKHSEEHENVYDVEVKQVSTDGIYRNTEDVENPLKNKKLESTAQILKQTLVCESLSADADKMKFFINYFLHKLWRKTFDNENKSILDITKDYESMKNNPERLFARDVYSTFLFEYDHTKKLKIPQNKFPFKPFLMQKYIAYKIKKAKRFANFSGTGTGKTFSGVLASRLSNCKMTVVICPNHVVNQWKKRIIIPNEGPIFENSEAVTGTDAFLEKRDESKRKFLIINWDKLNQRGSTIADIDKLQNQKIDMIILDEVHFAKNSDAFRRESLEHLISNIKRKNKNFKLLALTATPIVNNLKEGKSLLELISGILYPDLKTNPFPMNAVKLYEHFTNISIRHFVDYDNVNLAYWDVEAPFPKKEDYPHVKQNPLGVEVLLTEARISTILEKIDGPTLIYTEYIGKIPGHERIDDMLEKAVKEKIGDDNVGLYTGRRAEGLQLFLDGDIQVLIASRPISVGVDDLQYRCKNLIFNSLPWTNASYRQIIGRVVRTGMDESHVVNIHHIRARFPGIFYDTITKLKRIDYKKDLADCAVDGTAPEGVLVTPKQATEEIMSWIGRLNRGEVSIVFRYEWDRQLTASQENKLLRKLGDISKMNQQYAITSSSKMHDKLIKDKEWFIRYHELQERTDNDLKINPRDYWIRVLKGVKDRKIIGDFGCGKAQIQEAIGTNVISFEHVAIDDFTKVKCCDIGNEKELRMFLGDGDLDVALFCRSLSCGKNWKDYIKNAHWSLAREGQLYIAEPTSKVENKLKDLRKIIKEEGFQIYKDEIIGEHTFIRAIKL